MNRMINYLLFLNFGLLAIFSSLFIIHKKTLFFSLLNLAAAIPSLILLINLLWPNLLFIKIIFVCLSFVPALYTAFIISLTTANNKNNINIINFLLGLGFATYFLLITGNPYAINEILFIIFLVYFYFNLLSFILLFKMHVFKPENFLVLLSGILLFTGLALNFLVSSNKFAFFLGSGLILVYAIFTCFSLVKLRIFKTTHFVHQTLLKLGIILVLILGYILLVFYLNKNQYFGLVSIIYFALSLEIYFNFYQIFMRNISHEPYEYNKESRNIIKKLSFGSDMREIFSNLVIYFKELINIDEITFYVPQSFSSSGRIDLALIKFDYLTGEEDLSSILDSDIFKMITDKRTILSSSDENHAIGDLLKSKKISIVMPVYIKDKLLAVLVFGNKKSKENYQYIDNKLIELIGENLSLILERIRMQIIQLNKEISLFESMSRTMVHEINKPLSTIKNNLYSINTDHKYLVFVNKSVNELIEKINANDYDKEKCLKYLNFIKDQVSGIHQSLEAINNGEDALSKLVKSFSIYTIDTNQVVKSRIGLRPIIEKQLEAVTSEIERLGIKLITNIKSDAAIIAAESQVEIILNNLIDNAIIAIIKDPNSTSKIRKEITIELSEKQTTDKSYVYLKVSDTGLGITEEEKRNIFTPFYSNKQYFSGIGLGLTSVKKITDELKAKIDVISSNEGTSFIIAFSE